MQAHELKKPVESFGPVFFFFFWCNTGCTGRLHLALQRKTHGQGMQES